MSVQILVGDSLTVLRTLPSNSVHCVVTSPPYWGLRDYGVEGQIGLESTPTEFIAAMVAIFEEVRRVLREDGTCWINIGDSYANDGKWGGSTGGKHVAALHGDIAIGRTKKSTRLKPKDICMMPHRVAIALQDSGWWVRQDIVWSKPNPMPESVTDRCTKSHEYIFLLTKSEHYYYDRHAIAEPVTDSTVARLSQDIENQFGSDRVPGKTNGRMKAVGSGVGFGRGFDAIQKARVTSRNSFCRANSKRAIAHIGQSAGTHRPDRKDTIPTGFRNKRSVWTMSTRSFKDAHFATFPPELPEICIEAGCPIGGTVLDPFFGAGTTGLVADRLQRNCIGIELNPVYAEIARKRIQSDSSLFADVLVAA